MFQSYSQVTSPGGPRQMDVPYRSIPDMMRQRVADSPDRQALGFPTPEEEIAWLTWTEVDQRVTALAAGLVGLGVAPGDRVAILAGTRVEWILADFAIMCAGAVTTAVYPTTEPDEAVFILRDSGAKVIIAENPGQAAKVAEAHPSHVVLIDGAGELTLASLEAAGADALVTDPGLVDRIIERIGPDALATFIYTSGTTGRPKGVELTHGGWCWVGVAQGEPGLLSPDDLHYLWLPLSHSFGKALVCGLTHVGLPTYVDGRVDKLVAKLGEVRPTLMAAPPRIYEKGYNAMVTTATAGGGLKAKIFDCAVRVGKRAVALEQDGKSVPGSLALQRKVADRLVFSKLRARLGGRIRILCSGAAPLSPEIALFFAAAGLPLMEGYGLSESSASNFVNRPGRLRIGTVGERLGDLECRIAEDGEILLRGAPVMRGYHNRPDDTAEAF